MRLRKLDLLMEVCKAGEKRTEARKNGDLYDSKYFSNDGGIAYRTVNVVLIKTMRS